MIPIDIFVPNYELGSRLYFSNGLHLDIRFESLLEWTFIKAGVAIMWNGFCHSTQIEEGYDKDYYEHSASFKFGDDFIMLETSRQRKELEKEV